MTQTAGAAPEVTSAVTAASGDVPGIEPRVPRAWWRLILLLFGALGFIFAFYYMIVVSLHESSIISLGGVVPRPGNLALHNSGQINAALSLGKALINSGIFTGGVLLGTLVFGVLAGY